MLFKFRAVVENVRPSTVAGDNSLDKCIHFENHFLCYFSQSDDIWKYFLWHCLNVSLYAAETWIKDSNDCHFLQYSRCHLHIATESFVLWLETVLLYVWRTNRLMGGHGSSVLTIKGPAVTHSPITSTTQWLISGTFLFFWQVYISVMDWH